MTNQMPNFDQAFAALIRDLDKRGLLDSTMVMVSRTEFGRTPKINATAGRDHWPRVFNIVLAGGGIKRGSSMAPPIQLAASRIRTALTVENLAHTVYHQMGIDPARRTSSRPEIGLSRL
jgi:uncharacterized protein (DUF1501 family)